MDAVSVLADLDDDQRRAVATPTSLVAVVAGAGSGKTRVLTRRVAFRVLDGTAAARHTLVLTFTRQAAGELRRRLPRLGLQERVEAGTFHAVMLGVLRQRWEDLGRRAPNVVNDRRRLVAELTSGAPLDEVVGEIDWATARGISPERYPAEARRAGRHSSAGAQAVAECYEAYRVLKRRRGIVDLDDLLTMAADALQTDADFAAATRWRYRHLLVDEAQDLNPLQHRLIDLLRQGNDDLFLVGDPAQAVYGFNGADPGLLVDVSDRFPGIEIVRLPVNHRSTPQIVEAGAHVLRTGGQATGIRSSRPDGPSVRVIQCDDAAHEATTVARLVRRLDPGAVLTGQVAVLARTHAQLTGLGDAFADAGIGIRRRIDGPGSPYRDPVAAASRQGTAARLRAWAHDLLDDLDSEAAPAGAADEQRAVADVVLAFLREQPLGDGAGFRAWVGATDPFGLRGQRGVELLTFHAAKGREWHTVYVTGVETGLVPHRTAATNVARAEETRLLYVALTRATDELVITWAARRGGYRRRRSPLLERFEPTVPDIVPPPSELFEARPEPVLADAVHARLVAWRERAARAAAILPDELCSSSVLRVVAAQRPASVDELAAVSGLGPITAARLYPGIAEVLAADRDGAPADVGDQSRRSTTTGA